MSDLKEKQKAFCREYLIDSNGKQAAIRSGYSIKTAENQASRLLSKEKVRQYLGSLKEKQIERLEVTADMVVQELAKMAFFDPSKLYNSDGTPKALSELDVGTRAVISELGLKSLGGGEFATIEKYAKTYDKQKALELLGRHLGMFTEKKEVKHSGEVVRRTINVNPTKGTKDET